MSSSGSASTSRPSRRPPLLADADLFLIAIPEVRVFAVTSNVLLVSSLDFLSAPSIVIVRVII